MKTMQSAEDCMRKDILAYVSYPPRVQGACFPYLQYEVMNNGEIAEIPAEIFPQTGAIVVPFRDQLNATEVRETFGNIVVLRINRDSPDENTFMEDQAGSPEQIPCLSLSIRRFRRARAHFHEIIYARIVIASRSNRHFEVNAFFFISSLRAS